jgi:RNA polymerase sigma-70 factor (ECF subfamily)
VTAAVTAGLAAAGSAGAAGGAGLAGPVGDDVVRSLDRYRGELTAHCRRLLGSATDAEDAAQEALVRAWKAVGRFEGRCSMRSWLYAIATNVCLDHLRARRHRAEPVEVGAGDGSDGHEADRTRRPAEGPPDVVVAREAVRLAFVAALAHLPTRQRAALILYDVLRWRATEVAELLGTTEASVTSLVQRARATLAARIAAVGSDADRVAGPEPRHAADRRLLARYVDAFERYDVEALVALVGTTA